MPLFLWHVSMLYTFSCMLVAHTTVWPKNYTIPNLYKHDQNSYKREPVACQLHSDWLHMTRFLVVHATCMKGNQSYSWFLVVRSQIDNFIFNHSFDHNLCFKYPNGSYEPILDIHIPRDFQWYNKLFDPMGFDPCNHVMKIWETIGISTPNMRAHLGVWGFIPSHFPTLLGTWSVTPKFHFWLAPSQALALIVNPRLGLWQYHSWTMYTFDVPSSTPWFSTTTWFKTKPSLLTTPLLFPHVAFTDPFII